MSEIRGVFDASLEERIKQLEEKTISEPLEMEKRITQLETAVKDLKLTLNKILEFMEAYSNGKL
jgi:hypothetical protein